MNSIRYIYISVTILLFFLPIHALFTRECTGTSEIGSMGASATTGYFPLGLCSNPALRIKTGLGFEASGFHPMGVEEWTKQKFSIYTEKQSVGLALWYEGFTASDVYAEQTIALRGRLHLLGKESPIFWGVPHWLGQVHMGVSAQARGLWYMGNLEKVFPGENFGLYWQIHPRLHLGASWQDYLSQSFYPAPFFPIARYGFRLDTWQHMRISWSAVYNHQQVWRYTWNPEIDLGSHIVTGIALINHPFQIGMYLELKIKDLSLVGSRSNHPDLNSTNAWGLRYHHDH